MFRLEGLGPKPDPEEIRRKMRADVWSTARNFLIYVVVLRAAPFVLQQLDKI
ncbi:mitochondrial import receptor subunit TOM5 homolog [Petromyzon marinus]|uniref:Mitochondrial import receptor subunit TOM5 homolog n=1 Tax=Petromyzon marinus TaxID=7757 RepID=A0AAJ7X2A4_PETMA|nr:mitochondrial import receptor subunit TOM5 homolog [Petromyzon marinus]